MNDIVCPSMTAVSPKSQDNTERRKKKQSELLFTNQSVIYNDEGKKHRNKTIYSVDHPRVVDLKNPFIFSIGQVIENIHISEFKSQSNITHFNKIQVEHLGFTNLNNMDPSKTTAVEFVNVVAFKRKNNDSRILWIYESLLTGAQTSPGESEQKLKRKLGRMLDEDEILADHDSSSSVASDVFHGGDNIFSGHSIDVGESSESPFSSSDVKSIDYAKRVREDFQDIENLFLESTDPVDAPSKKPTLFQLSIHISNGQPFHLFNPLTKEIALEFVSTMDGQTGFLSSVISVQPVISGYQNSIMSKDFIIYGKTPLVHQYDSLNTIIRLTVDGVSFQSNRSNEQLFFYFYDEEKRRKNVEIIQNPNTRNQLDLLEDTKPTSQRATTTLVNDPQLDFLLFDFLGEEDNFPFHSLKSISCTSMYDKFKLLENRFSSSLEAIKNLVHLRDAFGFTLLMHFAARNMTEESKQCIEWGINVHQRDYFGNDALWWANHFKAMETSELITRAIENQHKQQQQPELSNEIRRGLYPASTIMEQRMMPRGPRK